MEAKIFKYSLKLKLVLIFSIFLGIETFAQVNEYTLKTSFLFKFAKYTEWPANNNNYFVISVIGENPFKKNLEEVASKKKIKGKEIRIKYINSIEEIGNSNILFIPKSEKKNISSIVEYSRNKPILLVSEVPKAAQNGVHINFVLKSNKTFRFEINKNCLKSSNIKMSSLLLNIAESIK